MAVLVSEALHDFRAYMSFVKGEKGYNDLCLIKMDVSGQK